MRISTLSDLKRHGMRLYAACEAPNVGHGAYLDLDALIERFGPDYSYVDDGRIGRACRCQKCGHLGAMVLLMPRDGPSGHVVKVE